MSGGEPLPAFVEPADRGVLVHVKVVPGARRSEIMGPLGDRLKIRVAAPPEGGRANEEVSTSLAAWLDVASADVALVRGATNPRKTFRIEGDVDRLVCRLADDG